MINENKSIYADIVHKIKMALMDYIEAEGIEILPSGAFSCPNKTAHQHEDRNKSASVRVNHEEYPRWQCFSCNEGGDTIAMGAFMHNLPMEGKGFLVETIPFLAEKLGLELPKSQGKDSVEDESVRLSMEAKRYIKDNPIMPVDLTSNTYGRGYSNDLAMKIIAAYPIGRGSELANRSNIILHHARPGTILIPIYENGLVVGIVARNRIDSNEPKYQNSIKNKDKGITYKPFINIDKGILLASKKGILYIFEGVFNTIAAIAYEFPAVGILGVSADPYLIAKKIQDKATIKEVVICLDKDTAGKEAAVKLGRILHNCGINISFLDSDTMPKESYELDYDICFSSFPTETTTILKDYKTRISLVEYTIKYKVDYMNDENLTLLSRYNNAVADIASYGSALLISSYSKLLSESFKELGASPQDITISIKDALRDVNSPLIRQIDKLMTKSADEVLDSRSIELKQEKVRILYETTTRMVNTGGGNIVSIARRKMDDLQNSSESDTNKVFSTGLSNLDNALSDPSQSGFYLTDSMLVGIAGKPGHCKSIIARKLALSIASLHQDDTFVVYFSIDDSKKRTYQWTLCGYANVSFGYVFRHFMPKSAGFSADPEMEEKLKKAKITASKLLGKNLFIFDKTEAGTTEEIVIIMKRFCEAFPGKYPVFFIDNMYNINNIARANEKRAAVEQYIDIVKEICSTRKALVVNTLEVLKNLTGRISSYHLKESGVIDYRNDVTLSVFNSWKEWDQKSLMYEEHEGSVRPIIELKSLKLKIGQSGHIYYFDLDGPTGNIYPITETTRVQDLNIRLGRDRGNDPENPGSSDDSSFGKGTIF